MNCQEYSLKWYKYQQRTVQFVYGFKSNYAVGIKKRGRSGTTSESCVTLQKRRYTSHVTRHTSHVTRHTSNCTQSSPINRYCSTQQSVHQLFSTVKRLEAVFNDHSEHVIAHCIACRNRLAELLIMMRYTTTTCSTTIQD